MREWEMWTIRDSSTLRPVEDPVRRWETPATPTDRLVPMAPRVPTFPSSWVHSHSFPRLCVARPRSFSAMRASGNGHRLFRCPHTGIYMRSHPRRRNRFCHYDDEGRAFAVSYFSSGRVFGVCLPSASGNPNQRANVPFRWHPYSGLRRRPLR